MDPYPVCRLKKTRQFVLVLQYPGVDTGVTCLVAPLYPEGQAPPMEPVTPLVQIGEEKYLVAFHLMAAVRKQDIGPAEASLVGQEHAFSGAINRLFFGI
jgi:hypothetical protein